MNKALDQEGHRGVRVDGAALRELRKSRGLTQTALADMTGFGERTIRSAENNGAVSPYTLRTLADALNVEPDTLVLAREMVSFRFRIGGVLQEASLARIGEITELLSRIADDLSLQVEEIGSGSIVLYLRSTPEGFARLSGAHSDGMLAQELRHRLGVRVLDGPEVAPPTRLRHHPGLARRTTAQLFQDPELNLIGRLLIGMGVHSLPDLAHLIEAYLDRIDLLKDGEIPHSDDDGPSDSAGAPNPLRLADAAYATLCELISDHDHDTLEGLYETQLLPAVIRAWALVHARRQGFDDAAATHFANLMAEVLDASDSVATALLDPWPDRFSGDATAA